MQPKTAALVVLDPDLHQVAADAGGGNSATPQVVGISRLPAGVQQGDGITVGHFLITRSPEMAVARIGLGADRHIDRAAGGKGPRTFVDVFELRPPHLVVALVLVEHVVVNAAVLHGDEDRHGAPATGDVGDVLVQRVEPDLVVGGQGAFFVGIDRALVPQDGLDRAHLRQGLGKTGPTDPGGIRPVAFEAGPVERKIEHQHRDAQLRNELIDQADAAGTRHLTPGHRDIGRPWAGIKVRRRLAITEAPAQGMRRGKRCRQGAVGLVLGEVFDHIALADGGQNQTNTKTHGGAIRDAGLPRKTGFDAVPAPRRQPRKLARPDATGRCRIHQGPGRDGGSTLRSHYPRLYAGRRAHEGAAHVQGSFISPARAGFLSLHHPAICRRLLNGQGLRRGAAGKNQAKKDGGPEKAADLRTWHTGNHGNLPGFSPG